MEVFAYPSGDIAEWLLPGSNSVKRFNKGRIRQDIAPVTYNATHVIGHCAPNFAWWIAFREQHQHPDDNQRQHSTRRCTLTVMTATSQSYKAIGTAYLDTCIYLLEHPERRAGNEFLYLQPGDNTIQTKLHRSTSCASVRASEAVKLMCVEQRGGTAQQLADNTGSTTPSTTVRPAPDRVFHYQRCGMEVQFR